MVRLQAHTAYRASLVARIVARVAETCPPMQHLHLQQLATDATYLVRSIVAVVAESRLPMHLFELQFGVARLASLLTIVVAIVAEPRVPYQRLQWQTVTADFATLGRHLIANIAQAGSPAGFPGPEKLTTMGTVRVVRKGEGFRPCTHVGHERCVFAARPAAVEKRVPRAKAR